MAKGRGNKKNKHTKSSSSSSCGNCGKCDACSKGCSDSTESYSSKSSSSSDCFDFSELARDGKQDCDKKSSKSCKKSSSSSTKSSSSKSCSTSSESSSDSSSCSDSDDCSGCESKCKSCTKCQACGCKDCSDYSVSSVMKELSDDCYSSSSSCSVSSSSSCESFSDLAKDESASCSDLSVCDKKVVGKKSGSKKFVVTFGKKDKHCHSDLNTSGDSIYINGKNGPVLHLYRGCTYYFSVEQSAQSNGTYAHSFVLTLNPVGNYKGVAPKPLANSFAAVASGVVSFKVESSTPRYFYYQCANHSFEGGLVIVHNQREQ